MPHTHLTVAALLVTLTATGAGAAVPGPDGVIHGCYLERVGGVRLIDPLVSRCLPLEKPISWSQKGPQGPRGEPGPQGPPGPAGTCTEHGVPACPAGDLLFSLGPGAWACRRLCSGTLVDTRADPAHCGACGNTCPAGEACIDGGCVCTGPSCPCTGPSCECQGAVCGGKCVDLTPALLQQVAAALPPAVCSPSQTRSLGTLGATASTCSARTCAGSRGCSTSLSWGPLTFNPQVGQLTGSAQASTVVDVEVDSPLLPATSCSLTVTVDLSFVAGVSIVSAVESQRLALASLSLDAANGSTTGCEGVTSTFGALPALVLDAVIGNAVLQLSTLLSPAIEGAVATCPTSSRTQ